MCLRRSSGHGSPEPGDPTHVPSIALRYGPADDPRLALDLPGLPGESMTPRDGDSAGRGEAQVWWSLPGSVAAYGHACSLRYEAEPLGGLTGVVRCPRERTDQGQRYRVDITFDAEPLLPGPLPTPQPTPAPSPPSLADLACRLLGAEGVEAAADLRTGSLMLLDAGPGQCVGFAGDREVAFIAVGEAATPAELVPSGEYRGMTCEPLRLALGDAARAGSCTWPDGRDVIVGSVLSGSIMLTISLSLEDSDAETLLPQVAALLATALDRLP